MCPPDYNQNGFVATHTSCAQMHELPQCHCGNTTSTKISLFYEETTCFENLPIYQ